MNKVVVRFTDGRVLKGTTADFFPNKDTFHVSAAGASDWENPLEINLQDDDNGDGAINPPDDD